jgi:hypothetical protein
MEKIQEVLDPLKWEKYIFDSTQPLTHRAIYAANMFIVNLPDWRKHLFYFGMWPLFFFYKLRASKYQGMNKHLNYVDTLIHTYPTPISHNNILNKKKICTKSGGGGYTVPQNKSINARTSIKTITKQTQLIV